MWVTVDGMEMESIKALSWQIPDGIRRTFLPKVKAVTVSGNEVAKSEQFRASHITDFNRTQSPKASAPMLVRLMGIETVDSPQP